MVQVCDDDGLENNFLGDSTVYNSEEEDEPFDEKSQTDEEDISAADDTCPLNIETLDSRSRNVTKIAQQDAQIRDFFTMKCEICTDNITFETLRNAKDHYRSVHNKSGYLMCCGNKFHSRYRALDHIRFHINPDAYRCVQCDKSFKERQALKTHMDNHERLHLREHECSICGNSFLKAVSLKIHMQNVHSSPTGEMFPCEKCSKT